MRVSCVHNHFQLLVLPYFCIGGCFTALPNSRSPAALSMQHGFPSLSSQYSPVWLNLYLAFARLVAYSLVAKVCLSHEMAFKNVVNGSCSILPRYAPMGGSARLSYSLELLTSEAASWRGRYPTILELIFSIMCSILEDPPQA